MKSLRLLIPFVSIILSSTCNGQGFFKPEKKIEYQKAAPGLRALVAVAHPDSVMNVYRPTAAAGWGLPDRQILGAVGISLQHQQYDFTNDRWQSIRSIGLYAYGLAAGGPKTVADITGGGVFVGIFNDLIKFGPTISLAGRAGVFVMVGINFNN